MNTNTPTKMVFLMTDGDRFYKPEVMAYLPDENYNRTGTLKMCYMHNGQHGPCSEAYALDCKPATFKQYKSLLFELKTKVGYTVTVLDAKVWRQSNGKRRQELRVLDRECMEVPKRTAEEQAMMDEIIREEQARLAEAKVA
jgi:hypothetical protein